MSIKKNIRVCDEKQTGDPKYLPPFEIKLINKFDEDKRNIRVWHNKKDYVLHHSNSQNKHKQYQKQGVFEEMTFELKPDDSLIIELAYEEGDFRELTKDVYFELPFIADYTLSFETATLDKDKEIVKRPVAGPVTYITRNTDPKVKKRTKDGQILTEEGKTVVRIPGHLRTWKLQIWSPRNMKEHCHTKNVLATNLEMTNGRSDSSSVGDNGP